MASTCATALGSSSARTPRTTGGCTHSLHVSRMDGWALAGSRHRLLTRPTSPMQTRRSRTVGHQRRVLVLAAEGPGKGFGKPPPPPPPPKKPPVTPVNPFSAETLKERKAEVEDPDDVIPEVVTNRILKRLTVTVGLPLVLGLGFFPLFYYLKVVQKVDVPEWLPLISSVMLFGLAGLGISYGVISTSWDPERDGTLLGWKEARANWPVFMQTMSRKKE